MKHVTQTAHSEKAHKSPSYFSSSTYSVLDGLSDAVNTRVQKSSLEDEFVSNLALVEDLHNRFRFMITELKTSGLKVDE